MLKMDSFPENCTESYKISEKTFVPLNLVNHEYDDVSYLILWNRFTIIVKEIEVLSNNESIHYTSFLIKNVYFIKNIFLCLDDDLFLHFTILRKKDNPTKILEKLEFKTILKNVFEVNYSADEIFVLLKKESDVFFYVYTIIGSSKMKVSKTFKINLNVNLQQISMDSNVQMIVKPLKYFSIDFIENVFHIEISQISLESQMLLLVKYNILFWSLLETDTDKSITLSILNSCPVPIKKVFLFREVHSRIYLSLVSGSIIVIFYDIIDRCVATEVIHLNSALERVIFIKESVMYTDGDQLWHTMIESTNNDFKLKHQMLSVSAPYDFFYNETNRKAYCITLHNMLYVIDIQTDNCIKSKSKELDIVAIPKNLIDTKKLICEIQKETVKNDEVLNSLTKEDNYITALYFNRKGNFLTEHLFTSAKIYVISCLECENDIILIENLHRYYEHDVYIYVVSFEVSKHLKDRIENMNKFSNDFWHLDIQLRGNDYQSSFNASVKVNKSPKLTIAIPISKQSISFPIRLETKLIALEPGVYNKQHLFWCVVPSDGVIVDSLYYLELPNLNPRKRFLSNRASGGNVRERICAIAAKNCGLLFETEENEKHFDEGMLSYYIKLPFLLNKHADKFAQEFAKELHADYAQKLKEKICSSDFLDVGKALRLQVWNYAVDILVEKMEGHHGRLKISSDNVNTCWDVYKTILDILRSISDKHCPKDVVKSVPHFDYMILQNLRENIENIIHLSEDPPRNILTELSEGFYRDVIGILPI